MVTDWPGAKAWFAFVVQVTTLPASVAPERFVTAAKMVFVVSAGPESVPMLMPCQFTAEPDATARKELVPAASAL